MTVQQGLRAAGLRGLCGGRRPPAGRPGVRHGAVAVEPPDVRPTPPRWPTPPSRTRSPRSSALPPPPGCRSPRRAPGTAPRHWTGRLGDAVLLRTSAMNELQHRRRDRGPPASAPACSGATWPRRPGAHGLAALHPSSPDVGVVGYSIGGGIGWYARHLGLQCNAVTAVELVLADGTFVRATADDEPDLFWALRGGGTPLGVVCSLEFGLLPAGDRGRRVPRLGLDGRRGGPARLGRVVRGRAGRGDDLLPAAGRPRPTSRCRPRCAVAGWPMIDGAVLGDDAFAAEVLAPLRALAPEIDTIDRVPAAVAGPAAPRSGGADPGVREQHAGLRAPRRGHRRDHRRRRPAAPGTGLAMAELRQLGGALPGPTPGAGSCPLSTAASSRSESGWSPTRRTGRSSARTPPGSWPRSSRGRPGGTTCRCSTTAPTPERRSRRRPRPALRDPPCSGPRRPVHGAAPVASEPAGT